MGTLNTDKAWKAYGDSDPYYGVLAHDEYLSEGFNADAKEAFFISGKHYVSSIWNLIETRLDANFKPKKALDFGCGTGRLVLPLAKKAQEITGIDISAGMLKEAEKNATEQGIENTSFMLSEDWLKSHQPGSYDFVNSYIVLQHINEERGLFFFEKLVEAVSEDGIGALQITFENRKTSKESLINFFRYRIPLFNNLLNLFRGKKFGLPLMQMTTYNMNDLYMKLHDLGVYQFHTVLTDHGGHYGAMLIFKKGNKVPI